MLMKLNLVRRNEQDGKGDSEPGPRLLEGSRKLLGSTRSRPGGNFTNFLRAGFALVDLR